MLFRGSASRLHTDLRRFPLSKSAAQERKETLTAKAATTTIWLDKWTCWWADLALLLWRSDEWDIHKLHLGFRTQMPRPIQYITCQIGKHYFFFNPPPFILISTSTFFARFSNARPSCQRRKFSGVILLSVCPALSQVRCSSSTS